MSDRYPTFKVGFLHLYHIMKKLLLIALFLAHSAWADTPLKIVVPFVPGGPTDIVARTLQKSLSDEIRRPVIVENRPGGAGVIATNSVINSNPRDIEILITSSAIILNTFKNPVPFQESQLIPVAYLGSTPFVLVSSKKFGVSTFKQWQDLDPKRPITYGTSGIGSATHLVTEYFNQQIPKNMTHVPYKGSGQVLPDLISGNIDFAFLFSVNAVQNINAGKVIPIAVEAGQRLPELPNVPTFKELGVSDLGNFSWFMLFANQTQNTEELARIQRAIYKILTDPANQDAFKQTGLEITKSKIIPQKNFIDHEKRKMARIIKKIDLE